MLHHLTLDTLQARRLSGMYHALREQMQTPEITARSFEERLGLLVDCESTARENRRLTTRLRQAKLRQTACLEDIDYRHPRGLDKALMTRLGTCPWVQDRQNILITPHRDWEDLARLRVRPQGLSRRLDRAVPPAAPLPARTAHCQG